MERRGQLSKTHPEWILRALEALGAVWMMAPSGWWYQLLPGLGSWGQQHSLCMQQLCGSELRFPSSGQSNLCGGMCICWESINNKGLPAVDDSYPSSPCGCLPTGLHFELQQCLGKKLNHNYTLIWAVKMSPVRNLLSPGMCEWTSPWEGFLQVKKYLL